MEENKNPVEENKTSPEPVPQDCGIVVTPSNTVSQNNPIEENKTPETTTMEVHHHPELHHKPKPWKEYFLEFIMIVLAVTTGFFADNLRENLADREKEKQVMTSLVNCLASDTAQLNSIMKSNYLITVYHDSLRMLKNADLTTEENNAKFYEYGMNSFAQDVYFTTNDAAMQQLKSAGMMRLIKKQNIIDSILGYESVNKSTVAQEADCYFLFKESLLDYKKVVDFIVVRDPSYSSYTVKYAFNKIHLKKTRGLSLNNDPEKLNAVFNDATVMAVVIDGYIDFLNIQLLYAKRLIAFLNKEYNLKSE